MAIREQARQIDHELDKLLANTFDNKESAAALLVLMRDITGGDSSLADRTYFKYLTSDNKPQELDFISKPTAEKYKAIALQDAATQLLRRLELVDKQVEQLHLLFNGFVEALPEPPGEPKEPATKKKRA